MNHNKIQMIKVKDNQWNMKPDQAKALMLAKRQLAELVFDAVNLEGINFTLPEIQTFEVTAEKACELHQIAGKEEALECGRFRSGGVTIAGTEYMPPQAYKIPDIYDRAIFLFLTMARCQFFYDVNKRIGRFIMNGLLLSAGYPAINLPAKRQLEFNQLMLAFYESGDQKPMNTFLRSCLDERIIKIMKA
jgi:prophage maintenance system killer protein